MEYSAALYMRLSKDDSRTKSQSIDSQRKILLDFAKEKSFSVFGEYIDDGFSGTNFERPAFRKMIEDIESKKVNLVLIKDLSRLGRDYLSTGEFTEIYFPSKGVRCISVTDGYDSLENRSDFIPFCNIMNEMYARDTSKKIRSAFKARMKAGDFIGPFPPFGYMRSPKNRHKLVPEEKASNVVKLIFSESAKGKKPKEICRILDFKKVPTPLDFRNKSEKSRNWNSSTVLKIIKNPVYLGHSIQGKTTKISFRSKTSINLPPEKWYFVPDTHEAIIDPETFEKANKKRK